MHVQRRSGALLIVVAVLQLTARASAVTKTVLVGPDNTLTFRDMESGDSTTTSTTTLPPAFKCEDMAMRKLAGRSGPIVKCHARAARRGFKQEPFDEEACEARAKAQFDRAARKLPAATCPACLLGARAALRDQVESLLDAATGAAFCAAGAPFGGDDAGSA